MKNLSYSQRLSKLELYSLERRRLRGDLIEMYTILTGKEDVNCQHFFQPARDCYGLRGHSLKIFVHRSRLNCRKYFFSQRSVGEWNRLPQEVVDAPSVNAFKNRLDHFWTDVSTWLAAWRSGNGVGRINEVTLRRARLVLGWVTWSSTPGGGTLFRYVTSQPRPTQPFIFSGSINWVVSNFIGECSRG